MIKEWAGRDRERESAVAHRVARTRRAISCADTRDPLAHAALAAEQALGLTPFASQLTAAEAMIEGNIAELATGEGKTLALALAAAVLAPSGPVHIVTANTYLAARDAAWMAPLYNALNLRAAGPGEPIAEQAAADVLYHTLTDLAMSHLRDGLAVHPAAQENLDGVSLLVDEADYVLLDAATNQVTILAPTEDRGEHWAAVSAVVAQMRDGHEAEVDLETRQVSVTPAGIDLLCAGLGIDNPYAHEYLWALYMAQQCLAARFFFERDRHYLVVNDIIIGVDPLTGRPMPGRTWAAGLQQAIEATEGVPVTAEAEPLARMSVPAFIERYAHVAGTTGTAWDDRSDFLDIYHMDVVRVPPHRPSVRIDHPDRVFPSDEDRLSAIMVEASRRHATGQPVLIGATTTARAERLHTLLTRYGGIEAALITAADHSAEAQVLERAGERGAVTVASALAGRGVDIILGDGVTDLGGLCIIGCERHSIARQDRQLRGRAGRQGDPGESMFFLAASDELVRSLGQTMENMAGRLAKADPDEGVSLGVLSSGLSRVQRARAARERAIRVNLTQLDTILDAQRRVWRSQRDALVAGDPPELLIASWAEMIAEVVAHEEPAHTSAALRALLPGIPLPALPDAHAEIQAVSVAAHLLDWWQERRCADPELWDDLTTWYVLHAGDRRYAEHLELTSTRRLTLANSFGAHAPLTHFARDLNTLFEEWSLHTGTDVFGALAVSGESW